MTYQHSIRPLLGIAGCIATLIGFFLPYFVVSGPNGQTSLNVVDALSGAATDNLVKGLIDLVGLAVLVLLPVVSFVMMLLGRGNKSLRHSVLRLVGLVLVAGFLYTLVVAQFSSQISDISTRGEGLFPPVSGEAGPGLWLLFLGLLVVFICSIGTRADEEITKAEDDNT